MANIIAFAEVFRPMKQSSLLCIILIFAQHLHPNIPAKTISYIQDKSFGPKKERQVEQVWKGREGN
jgi:hypothetical protein